MDYRILILNWAVGKNSHKAEEPEILDSSARKIIWFDILDFLNQLEQPWAIDPNNLTYRQVTKVSNAKAHFENGGWMDASDVRGFVCDTHESGEPDDKRIVLEGKNRLVAALQLGETHAPFSVPLGMVDKLKTINIDNTGKII